MPVAFAAQLGPLPCRPPHGDAIGHPATEVSRSRTYLRALRPRHQRPSGHPGGSHGTAASTAGGTAILVGATAAVAAAAATSRSRPSPLLRAGGPANVVEVVGTADEAEEAEAKNAKASDAEADAEEPVAEVVTVVDEPAKAAEAEAAEEAFLEAATPGAAVAELADEGPHDQQEASGAGAAEVTELAGEAAGSQAEEVSEAAPEGEVAELADEGAHDQEEASEAAAKDAEATEPADEGASVDSDDDDEDGVMSVASRPADLDEAMSTVGSNTPSSRAPYKKGAPRINTDTTAVWKKETIYSQAPIRIPEDSNCPSGAVCLPEGRPKTQEEQDEDYGQITKMICTLGPSSDDKDVIASLIEAGMAVARLNFSHGDHASQYKILQKVRQLKAEDDDGKYHPIAIMLDTKGPEIRTGEIREGKKVHYQRGQVVTVTSDYSVACDSDTLSLSYGGFVTEVEPGQPIRIGDGQLNLEVVDVSEAAEGRVRAKVLNEAEIGPRKNCNIPGIRVNLPLLQEKDYKDLLEFALPHEVDFVALSFVQDGKSVEAVRKLLREKTPNGQSPPHLIAKIENGEGLRNFDEILQASDGIMVARGDLGMEIPPEQVFMAQKVMIGRCNLAGKFVITATQMLESMTKSPRPTRAEASDVANAVLDGSDCVMLSGETAAGLFPVEAVTMMSRICREAEKSMDLEGSYRSISDTLTGVVRHPDEGVCHAAVRLALDCKASAILALTESGFTARTISKYKPPMPIIACSPSNTVLRRLQMVRGVMAVPCKKYKDFFSDGKQSALVIKDALEDAKWAGFVIEDDIVVVVHGHPEKQKYSGYTNLVKVVTVPRAGEQGDLE